MRRKPREVGDEQIDRGGVKEGFGVITRSGRQRWHVIKRSQEHMLCWSRDHVQFIRGIKIKWLTYLASTISTYSGYQHSKFHMSSQVFTTADSSLHHQCQTIATFGLDIELLRCPRSMYRCKQQYARLLRTSRVCCLSV